MKSLLRIFSIALISCVALVSCGKITPTGGNEQGGDTPGTETGGGDEPGGNTDPDVTPRVIIISFDTDATRTDLDGGKPYFTDGDQILLAQKDGGAQAQSCRVNVDGGIASITVPGSLTGTLTAVYPVNAAVEENNKIVGVNVPSVQTGLFKDANICMVDILETDTRVVFKNQTALVAVKVPENTDYIEVTSLCEIDDVQIINSDPYPISNPGYGYRTSTQKAINNYGDDPYTIIVKNSDKQFGMNNISSASDYQKQTYYVSVLADASKTNNVRLIDLNFEIYSRPSSDSYFYDDDIVGEGDKLRKMGGFSPELIWRVMNDEKGAVSGSASVYAERNSIYNLPESSLHQYVMVGACKWATMNVGAISPTDSGDYFAWAGLDGHQHDGTKWTNFDSNARFQEIPLENFNEGFIYSNAPYTAGDYDKYDLSQETLCLWDDAAFVYWGGAWSMMPADSPLTGAILNGSTTAGGYLFSGVFLPYAGYGDNNSINQATSLIGYWTSTLDSYSGFYGYERAKIFRLVNIGSVGPIELYSVDRFRGYPIRPVSWPDGGISHGDLEDGGIL